MKSLGYDTSKSAWSRGKKIGNLLSTEQRNTLNKISSKHMTTLWQDPNFREMNRKIKQGNRWYNDGTIRKQFKEHAQPNGWVLGWKLPQ